MFDVVALAPLSTFISRIIFPPTLFQETLNDGRDHDPMKLWPVIGIQGGAACCRHRIKREGDETEASL